MITFRHRYDNKVFQYINFSMTNLRGYETNSLRANKVFNLRIIVQFSIDAVYLATVAKYICVCFSFQQNFVISIT